MFAGIALAVGAVGVIAVQRTLGAADEWALRTMQQGIIST
jgi:hypothetical protein